MGIDKKKIGLIGLGTSIIGTALAVTIYKKKKNESPSNKILTQANIINNILKTLENCFNELEKIKSENNPSAETTKRTLYLIKKMQKQLKAVNGLKDIDNIPEDIADIYEDLQEVKNRLSNGIKSIDIFNENSLNFLKNHLSPFEDTIETIIIDIEDYEIELKESIVDIYEDKNKSDKKKKDNKKNQNHSYQTIKFKDYNQF